VGYVDADVRDSAAIVAGARGTLELSQPTAVLLLFTLAYVQDTAEAAMVVSLLMASVPPGSYFVMYHLASDLDPALEEAARQWNKMMPLQPITLRSRADVTSLMTGLEQVPPGIVPITQWRPAADDPLLERTIPIYASIARKR
jgi:hypothetical protein